MKDTQAKEVKSGFDEFLEILADFRNLSAVMLGTSIAIPFIAYVMNIVPPWPPGLVLITVLRAVEVANELGGTEGAGRYALRKHDSCCGRKI